MENSHTLSSNPYSLPGAVGCAPAVCVCVSSCSAAAGTPNPCRGNNSLNKRTIGQVRPLPWPAGLLECQNPAETFLVPLWKGKRALPVVLTWLFCAVEVQVFNLRT